MLNKLVQKLKGMESERNTFDPSHIGDPIAMQTDWTPAKRGGANFRTHNLVKVNSSRLEFRASMGAKLFYLIFLLIGIGVLIGFSTSKLSSGGLSVDLLRIAPILFGLTFVIVGGCLLYFGTVPIVFDNRNRAFWIGRKAPGEVFDKTELKHFAEFENIHALQLISEYCRGDKSSYYSYELNLVLVSGKRINVVDHGSQNKLREDAAILSAFLKKPVWDAI